MAYRVDGAVAFIDLLGFGGHIEKHTHEENMARVESYAKAVEEATTLGMLPSGKGKCAESRHICLSYAIFSDTVVIYENVRPDRFQEAFTPGAAQWRAFTAILKACSRLSFLLLKNEQPFRGCITQGTYYVHSDKQGGGVIVAGKPVIEAYEWEGKQGWIGIMVRPDTRGKARLDAACGGPRRTENLALALAGGEDWHIMIEKSDAVPIRKKRSCGPYAKECHYAVVPTRKDHASPSQALESVREARGWLLSMKRDAPEDAQDKYCATLSWYAELESNLGRTNSALP